LATPLTDEECDLLDRFRLERIDEEADTLDISELDGLFTALVSGPIIAQKGLAPIAVDIR